MIMNAEMCSFLVILALIKFVKTCSEEFLPKKKTRWTYVIMKVLSKLWGKTFTKLENEKQEISFQKKKLEIT